MLPPRVAGRGRLQPPLRSAVASVTEGRDRADGGREARSHGEALPRPDRGDALLLETAAGLVQTRTAQPGWARPWAATAPGSNTGPVLLSDFLLAPFLLKDQFDTAA